MKVHSSQFTVHSKRNKNEKRITQNVLELVGDTPLVKLEKISTDGATILAKLESFNPGGSLKDRVALKIVEQAEKEGKLKPASTIVEASYGNMAVSLALVAAVRGYPLILLAPETLGLERRNLLESLGAKLILTPAAEGMKGAVKKASNLVKKNPSYYMPDQFDNPANPQAHQETTAQEIIQATQGKVEVLVAGVGTGGALTGVGRTLKSINPAVRIVAVEPASSPVLSGGEPGAHQIPGIGAGFIPKVLDLSLVDEIVPVSDEEAYTTTKRLLKEEGLLVGISSGAAAFAALKVAKKLGANEVVVVIFPDRGEKYFDPRLLL